MDSFFTEADKQRDGSTPESLHKAGLGVGSSKIHKVVEMRQQFVPSAGTSPFPGKGTLLAVAVNSSSMPQSRLLIKLDQPTSQSLPCPEEHFR